MRSSVSSAYMSNSTEYPVYLNNDAGIWSSSRQTVHHQSVAIMRNLFSISEYSLVQLHSTCLRCAMVDCSSHLNGSLCSRLCELYYFLFWVIWNGQFELNKTSRQHVKINHLSQLKAFPALKTVFHLPIASFSWILSVCIRRWPYLRIKQLANYFHRVVVHFFSESVNYSQLFTHASEKDKCYWYSCIRGYWTYCGAEISPVLLGVSEIEVERWRLKSAKVVETLTGMSKWIKTSCELGLISWEPSVIEIHHTGMPSNWEPSS
jgi:hypothetical protein